MIPILKYDSIRINVSVCSTGAMNDYRTNEIIWVL